MMPTYPLRSLRLPLPFGEVSYTLVLLTNSLEYQTLFWLDSSGSWLEAGLGMTQNSPAPFPIPSPSTFTLLRRLDPDLRLDGYIPASFT